MIAFMSKPTSQIKTTTSYRWQVIYCNVFTWLVILDMITRVGEWWNYPSQHQTQSGCKSAEDNDSRQPIHVLCSFLCFFFSGYLKNPNVSRLPELLNLSWWRWNWQIHYDCFSAQRNCLNSFLSLQLVLSSGVWKISDKVWR